MGDSSALKYTYQPLQPRHIRLLTITPTASHSDPLVCTLESRCLDDQMIYTALSYVWGDATLKRSLKLGPFFAYITVSLYDALLRVRRMLGKPAAIWADGVCINQEDLVERGQQVLLMGEIYTRAAIVLAWIGPAGGDDAGKVLNTMRSFNAAVKARGAKSMVKARKVPEQELPSWSAIKRMLEKQWFHRIWVVQEVGLASTALLMYGEETINWLELLTFCRNVTQTDFLTFFDLPASRVWSTWYRFSFGLPGFPSQANASAKYDFLDLLGGAPGFGASNDRDYIYALLGHPAASVDGQLIVTPEYAKSVRDVYADFTRNVLQQQKTLRILSFVFTQESPNEDDRWPSWVPDWAEKRSITLLGNSQYNLGPGFCASGLQTTSLNVISEDQIQLRGTVFDKIERCSDYMTDEHFAHSGVNDGISNASLSRVWNSVTDAETKLDDPLSSCWSAFGLALTAGGIGAVIGFDTPEKEKNDADFAACLAQFAQATGGTTDLRAGDCAPLEDLAERGDAERFIKYAVRIAHNRRIFRTARGRFGVGPKWLRPGDLCVVLLGGFVPFVIRRKEEGYRLVGEAYLHGCMHGEVVDLVGAGVLEVEGILLK